MTDTKPALKALPRDADATLAKAREEAYLNLFEAIRGQRPKPKRPALRAL